MGGAIGEFLPYAVGVAVSPLPIAAVMLMLVTKKARTNGPMFLLGWLVGLGLVGVIVLFIPGLEASQGEPSTATGWTKLVLGVLLLLLGFRAWRGRPTDDAAVEPPGWMNKLDGISAGGSFGLAILLSALNPKNLLLTVGGAATIAATGLSTSDEYIAVAVFVVIASLSILIPVGTYLLLGDRAENTMGNAKDWLINNNQTVMAVLLLLIGASLIGDAIKILL